MNIKCKKGVRFDILRDCIWDKLGAIYNVFKDAGYDCIITCGTEEHKEIDPHTNGYAIDLRSWHIHTEAEKKKIRDSLAFALGHDYYVLYEGPKVGEHFHIQVRRHLWPYFMENDPQGTYMAVQSEQNTEVADGA